MQDDIVIAGTTAARSGIALLQPPPYTACKIPFQVEERPSSRSAPCNQVLLVSLLLTTHPAFLFSPPTPHLYLPHNQPRIRMPLTELLIPVIAFILGILAAYLVFRQQISVIEGLARNDLERWKSECTNDIRKDSVNRSRSTLKGRISEQMAPLLLV
jgi:hypothetical protein